MKDKRPPKVVIRIYSRYVDVAVRKVRFSYARISALSRKIGVVVSCSFGYVVVLHEWQHRFCDRVFARVVEASTLTIPSEVG